MACHVFRQYIVLVVILFSFTKVYAQDFFTAALFAHARRGEGTSDTPKQITETNLRYYERAAAVAKANGADLITFPESGICFAVAREDLDNCAEEIDDSKDGGPFCPEENSTTPTLKALSCIAKNNSMNVIANMVTVKKCGEGSKCPEDGKLYYNTYLSFDRNGKLVCRYYQRYTWFEPAINIPTEKQDLTCKLDVGDFGMCTGFDIQYRRVGPDSFPDTLDAILYVTTGVTIPPLLISSSFWQAWAMGNNVTLLATNLQIPGGLSVGSGIYIGREGAVANTYGAEDGISKLIIAKVPKKNKNVSPDAAIYAINENNVEDWNTAAEKVPEQCDMNVLGPPTNVYTEYRCYSEDVSNYTLVKLDKPEGKIEACNNGMCCKLEYAADSMKETFYFGVKSNIHNVVDTYFWYEENCYLARCNDVGETPCGEFLMRTDTAFTKIIMTANFTTKYIYPALLSSQVKLVPTNDWNFEINGNQATISYTKDTGIKLISTGLKGRPYEMDPADTKEN